MVYKGQQRRSEVAVIDVAFILPMALVVLHEVVENADAAEGAPKRVDDDGDCNEHCAWHSARSG